MPVTLIRSKWDTGRLKFYRISDAEDVMTMAEDRVTLHKLMGLGDPEVVTLASGVATATKSFIQVASESGTTDQLDTLTISGAQAGDIAVLCADTGDTITVDDANIDLGAATRQLAGPNQFLLLIFNGSSWSELSFAAGDNS